MATEIHVRTTDGNTSFFLDGATVIRSEDTYVVTTGERTVRFPMVNVVWLVQIPPVPIAPDFKDFK